jgi:hypothetical protein
VATLLTDELWDTIALYLPQHPRSPKGGRPCVPDREAARRTVRAIRAGCLTVLKPLLIRKAVASGAILLYNGLLEGLTVRTRLLRLP